MSEPERQTRKRKVDIRLKKTTLEGGIFPPQRFAAPSFIKQMFILSYASRNGVGR